MLPGSVTDLWESYPASIKLFGNLREDYSRSAMERARCRGINAKMTLAFLVEISLAKDVLQTLQALSLLPQRRDDTAVSAVKLMV